MGNADETFWDDLLAYIDERSVIPIVGSELLRVDIDGSERLLNQVLAERLAKKLRVSVDQFSPDDALRQVISLYLEKPRTYREDIYPRVSEIFKESAFAVPDALKKLAQIRHFNLFVSTTPDGLLERAINEVRFEGRPVTRSIAYNPRTAQDLPADLQHLDAPVVFQLLGRVSAAPDYVITEDDTIEFLYAMQSKRPELLFDELKAKSLLLIGNSFPDWLARFFMRLAKGGRLSDKRSLEVVADRALQTDPNLVLFLHHFSYRTEVFSNGGAVEFVNELSDRYLQRHPVVTKADAPSAGGARAFQSPLETDKMPEGAIFLSYAREDLAAATLLRDALDKVGIEVWFDKHYLEGGDDFLYYIRGNIERCSLFIPLISATTHREGFFRKEWRMALDRAENIDDSIPFILPVAIDGTHANEVAMVPHRFLKLQWTRLPGGEPTPQFLDLIVRLIREERKRKKTA